MTASLRVVGLDLSTSATGLAHTHAANGEPRLAVRTITAGLKPLHDQIDTMEYSVRRACQTKPDVVVIEGSFSRPGASDYPLHALRGVITQWLHRQRIPYVDVQPATVKVWATGSGATRGENKVTKDKVCAAVVATYGGLLHINPRDDDACDAVALLALGLAAYGQPLADVPASHRRALSSVTWPVLDKDGVS